MTTDSLEIFYDKFTNQHCFTIAGYTYRFFDLEIAKKCFKIWKSE